MIEEAINKLDILLSGEIPDHIVLANHSDDPEYQQFCELFNEMISFFKESNEFLSSLSKGEWCGHDIKSCKLLASPFKELQSRLLHLSWQVQQITEGDFGQRVDFMGEFSSSFNAMIASLENKEALLNNRIEMLNKAIESLNSLEDILPICSTCKKIRQPGENPKEQKSWVSVEEFFTEKTRSQFSHSICPDCIKRYYPNFDFK